MKKDNFINVTQLPPPLKHPTIFKAFQSLAEGEAMVIHNDHDPKPLYYQLSAEYPDTFTWEYLQEGPQVWEVKITCTQKEETVGEIVAKDYRKAEVFKQFGIDFCCNGGKTLSEASKEVNINLDTLLSELEKADISTAAPSQDYTKWPLDFLADFIANTHHQYVRETAPIIEGLADKVSNVHGASHPELRDVAKRVKSLTADLMQHVKDEESFVFPAIKKLISSGKPNIENGESLDELIKRMHVEHDHAGEDLRYIRKITDDYALPQDACNSYMYLFEKLKEFEDDLFRHIHLENNILFPKSVALETV